jgi:formate dehydrogenase iron-sulfur subunit
MQLNRRDFLKLSGLVLASGIVRPAGMAQAAPAGDGDLGILFDSSKCIGCRACQMACKRWNKLPAETQTPLRLPMETVGAAKLYDTPQNLSADTWMIIKLSKRSNTDWHFVNYQCMHCADAACVTVCPSGALYKDPKGFTGYDETKCIGCGYCTQFCPYGVPHLRTTSNLTGQAKAAKCTFCQDRIYAGIGGPFCATSCPVGALVWGLRSDLLDKAKERVSFLRASGLGDATLYGETQAGGLGRMSILLGESSRYSLPASVSSPTLARAWKNVLQPVESIAIGGSLLAAVGAFLISRRYIHIQDVE